MSEDTTSKVTEAMVNLNMMETQANADLGITQEYNKQNRDNLWDSKERKASYKEKVFDGKQTYEDPISGKTLHKSQTAAQKKYHMKNEKGENVSPKWAKHSAETDHIKALKDVHNVVKYNPFLSDEDFREIMNSPENYRILSKSDNTAKGEKSDWEIITNRDNGMSKEARKQMAKEKINSDIALQKKFAARTAKNVGTEFVTGAKDIVVKSAIPLTVEAVRKLCEVAKGKETLDDAAKDMGKITANVAIAGGRNKVIVDGVTVSLRNSNKEVFIKLANNNEVAQIIAVAAIVKDSTVKYINGEINGREFIEEVGEKGTIMVNGLIGGEVGKKIGAIIGGIGGTGVLPGSGTTGGVIAGAVIGEVLGTIITTVVCSSIVSVISTTKHLNDYKLKESQIRRIEADALSEMSNQRDKLRSIFEEEYNYWDTEIQGGFDMILSSACEKSYNLQGITEGLDRILNIFGENIAFKSLEEYESQLGSTLVLNFGKK
ncbi:hypothetical protein ACFIJ5_07740 [Haloimpatiens sp. FM7330]|uniref:hypothetical protein n=1 Tax=Haloimpatiens sp. FM7330 TaxID=3298610 RepID=UPI00362BAE62